MLVAGWYTSKGEVLFALIAAGTGLAAARLAGRRAKHFRYEICGETWTPPL
jgi:hypothetical protein